MAGGYFFIQCQLIYWAWVILARFL